MVQDADELVQESPKNDEKEGTNAVEKTTPPVARGRGRGRGRGGRGRGAPAAITAATSAPAVSVFSPGLAIKHSVLLPTLRVNICALQRIL